MTLLHTMSLAGSVSTIIYGLLYGLTRRYFPMLWHRIYLFITVLLFIIPFPYYSPDYIAWIRKKFGIRERYYEGNLICESNRSIWIYKNRIYVPNLWLYIFIIICLVVCLSRLVFMFMKYYRVYKAIVANSQKGDTVKEKLKIDVKTPIYICDILDTPITMGIIHHQIILPQAEFTDDNLATALQHELIHIKMRDNLIKVLMLIAVALNFYNPFVYYLMYRWNQTAELYCDEQVIKGKSEQQINNYAHMIIDFAEDRNNINLPIMGLSISQRQMKERIINIKKKKRKYGAVSKVLGALIIVLAVFSSSLTSFAYQDRNVEIHTDEEFECGEIELFFNAGDAVALNEYDTQIKKIENYINADNCTLFIDNDGNVYYDTDIDQWQTYAVCSHTYVSGTVSRHVTDSSGGCSIYYYSGKRCSKCGNTVYGQYINTVSYAVCTH